MHSKKNKNILNYFFLIILLGSINNIELNKLNFQKIININISGLNEVDNLKLSNDIKNLNLKNIFLLKTKKVNEIIESNSLVENYNVIKIYPSTLKVKIKKTNFLAKINNNGKIFLIGSNGKISKNSLTSKQLPFVFGKPKIKEFLKFKKIIDQSTFSYDQIKNFYFFPSGRWDLELQNKMLIKLPRDNIQVSLNNAYQFLNEKKFEGIKIIDARIKNQIILND